MPGVGRYPCGGFPHGTWGNVPGPGPLLHRPAPLHYVHPPSATTNPEGPITAPDLRARSRAGDSPEELEAYLREHIPLSAAMDVRVERSDADAVILSAPLEPNINHRDTVFGGSASAVAILAGWALVHVRLSGTDGHHRIVIQRNEIEYLSPIRGRFRAVARAPRGDGWNRFLRMLERRGKGRVEITVEILGDDEREGSPVGHLTGQYVALGAGGHEA